MKHLILRLIITAVALYAATRFIVGIHFSGGVLEMLGVALVFTAVNAVLKPLLSMLTCPLIILTLGLFTLVINGIMLLATARLSTAFGLHFVVDTFPAAFWGGLLVGVASMLLTFVLDRPEESDR